MCECLALLEELDLRDTVLAGCGSGTGEVTRYLGTFGQRRVRGAALLAPGGAMVFATLNRTLKSLALASDVPPGAFSAKRT